MNTVAPLMMASCPEAGASRERLLAATAHASRLLLESSDVMACMPQVLQIIGEAASVDRTTLALADTGADGRRWLEVRAQWNAPGITPVAGCNAGSLWSVRREDCFCSDLSAGRSVYLCATDYRRADSGIAGPDAKSSIIVPFLVDGEYAGAVGFDHLRAEREFDPVVVWALEIAASVVGAALQRDRLMQAVRRERESAAEQRVAELARTNAALRSNLARLASRPAEFFDNLLVEAMRHAGARAATVVMMSFESEDWQVVCHAHDGGIATADFAHTIPGPQSLFVAGITGMREPRHVRLDGAADALPAWPELVAFHRNAGHRSLCLLPLVFGDNSIGLVCFGFRTPEPLPAELEGLLIALGQQVTLALALKRSFHSARRSAVLAERNRLGREIHDGLAQAFTGILMQLGAAEELVEGTPLAATHQRIRDIAREGLAEARRSVVALRPDEQARPGGLELALRQLAERSIVDGRIATRFAGGCDSGLPPEHEHALLRIAQEAVINAVRHAQPRNIEILLEAEGEEHLLLRISDDGVGMPQARDPSADQGFGLTNMRERAQAIGGQWHIESRPGAGTRVSVRIPRNPELRACKPA